MKIDSALYELERQKALSDYNLSTSKDEDLDLLTKLVSKVCNAPIAMINLVNDKKIIFKSNVGLGGASECDRENSFCSRVIEE